MTLDKSKPLHSRIQQLREPLVRVAVVGVGYIGLPLAVKTAQSGFRVVGLDIDEGKIEHLQNGISTVEGIPNKTIQKLQGDSRLSFMRAPKKPEDYEAQAEEALAKLAGSEIVLICVHTPLRRGRSLQPDIQWIKESARLIDALCRFEEKRGILPSERLLVLESTTFPGTSRDVFADRFRGFRDMRVYLAYSPERINPGRQSFGFEAERGQIAWNTPKVLGSADSESGRVAFAFYRKLFTEVHEVSNLQAAEFVKLLENTFRFIAIGFSNEMSRLASSMGLDYWELAEAARTKGFGFEFCDLGLAGGHCIPNDPHYLAWKSRRSGVVPALIEAAEMAHQRLARDAFSLIQELLNHQKRSLKGTLVLFWGIAYKPNVPDIRQSGVLKVANQLHLSMAEISYWDPVWEATGRPVYLNLDSGAGTSDDPQSGSKLPSRAVGSPVPIPSVDHPLPDEEIGCVVIGTDHKCFRDHYQELVDSQLPVVDLCNAIFNWAKSLSPERERDVGSKLSDPGRYALLGVGVGPLRKRIDQRK